jgi:drug/metabolite transporter (DMT)-like permease
MFVGNNLLILILAVCITFFAAVFDFDALHDGKLAVVEPVIGLELPIVVLLSIIFRGESLTLLQVLAIIVIFVGITLAVTQRKLHWHRRIILEKGFVYAGIGAVGMALTNFLYAVSSQDSSAIFTVWFIHTIIALVCLIILVRRRAARTILDDIKKYPVLILAMAAADNVAWLAYSSASTYIPISITTAVSENYIALALILGVVVNHEKFRKHQYAGAALAIIGLTMLAFISPQ